eukprot:CAMPEP_0195010920 /NCGR_PEP_ID=MMETSP0326_2-20130528/10518_1 /TAXON_ID=2866 ORGANISM="Crypthecodinium cohnii, Strain Seligo" /NCGR_SAMPLE_ID=MMETSP0326_2 /ASSEMBLY_ACC=CAM_ASM_000348 /LENGTH=176 /DNA_ID=CAMNT_0040019785 /DNA_START=286 /DNA_END=813 /DNA_ORIENTATION=-
MIAGVSSSCQAEVGLATRCFCFCQQAASSLVCQGPVGFSQAFYLFFQRLGPVIGFEIRDDFCSVAARECVFRYVRVHHSDHDRKPFLRIGSARMIDSVKVAVLKAEDFSVRQLPLDIPDPQGGSLATSQGEVQVDNGVRRAAVRADGGAGLRAEDDDLLVVPRRVWNSDSCGKLRL